MEISQDTSVVEILEHSFPLEILLDKSFSYVPSPPVNNPHDMEIRKPVEFPWPGIHELNLLMEGNITIQNTNQDLKYEDIAIKVRVTTSVSSSTSTVIHDFFIDPPFVQTGKGEVQGVRTFSRNVTVPARGRILVEILCNKVYSYNDGGNDARWTGKFDIINNSKIILRKQE
jgi:hypothetical protein